MELKDTLKGMESPDYKERFKAEYFQTKIRYEKLHQTITKMEAAEFVTPKGTKTEYKPFCGYEPTCPTRLLVEQANAMGGYLQTLEIRARIEKIDLATGEEIVDPFGNN